MQENKKTYTHVIWDFNGTILDDLDIGIDAANQMLRARGLAEIPSRDAYRALMRFPIQDYYADLGFDFEKEDYFRVLAPEWVALYEAQVERCGLVAEVAETLASVKDKGVHQLVLSAANLEQLHRLLRHLGVEDYFEEVLGVSDFYAVGKTALAKDWRERHPKAVPLFIGDTDHDALAAQTMGADCLLFTGGHQTKERLSACGKPLIDRIGSLLDWL